MNQAFSINRFGRLLRTYFTENRPALLTNLALLTVVLVGVSLLVYNQYPAIADRNRSLMLFFVGGVAWYIFTVQQMAVLNEKERAISYLLRPASKLEKWAQLVLISGVGFLVVYLALFTFIDAVGVWYINHRTWEPWQLAELHRSYENRIRIAPYYVDKDLGKLPAVFWVELAFLHPVALAFALVFRRYALPLIPVVVFSVLLGVALLNSWFVGALINHPSFTSAPPFMNLSVKHLEEYRQILIPQPTGDLIRYGVGILVVVVLYITAYFRLKEREV